MNDGKAIDYGFGLSLETYRGAKAVGHGGSDAGYRADVVRFPEHGLALAVLCNFAGATPGQYSRQVADIILEGKLAPVVASTTASNSAPVTLGPAQLAAVAGVYRRPGTDEAWIFVVRNGALTLTTFGGVSLTPLAERRFTAFGLVIEFGNAEPVEARALFGVQVIGTYRKVAAFTPTKEQLGAFAGEYRSDELGVTYHIAARDTGLVLQRRKFEDSALAPAFEDAFSGSVGTVHFTRLRGRVTGFLITGGRVRNLRFTKTASAECRVQRTGC